MPLRNLLLVALKDLFARRARLVLTLLGIVVGVSALLFLLSLTAGVRRVILKELVGSIPVTEMTATPKEHDVRLGRNPFVRGVGTLIGSRDLDRLTIRQEVAGARLTQRRMKQIENLPGVRRLYGILTLSEVPTAAEGWIFNIRRMHFFVDCVVLGVPAEVIRPDLRDPSAYLYRTGTTFDTPAATYEDGVWIDDREARYGVVSDLIEERGPQGDWVPVVLSAYLLQVYNIAYAGAGRKVPKLSEDTIIGQYFYITVGGEDEFTQDETERKPPQGVLCRVVGLSNRAPPFGFAAPPDYVREWHRRYHGEERPMVYRQAVVIANTPADVEPLQRHLDAMNLSVESQQETIEKINATTFYVGFGFSLVGLVILTISAVGISNVLVMSVNEERVDIGILRAVGAQRRHIRLIYMLKAAVLGVLGGFYGLLLGTIVVRLADLIAVRYVQIGAYRVESLFDMTSWIVAVSFAMGAVFPIAAGIAPANRAANLNPAVVLRQG